VPWEVNIGDECREWYEGLSEEEQDSITAGVELLMEYGPVLRRPHSDTLKGTKYPNMKELIVQHAGDPYRILYAFDPKREAILLVGGNKGGDDRWYEAHIPIAERLYEEHLERTKKGGK
jgi:hypothetical protein